QFARPTEIRRALDYRSAGTGKSPDLILTDRVKIVVGANHVEGTDDRSTGRGNDRRGGRSALMVENSVADEIDRISVRRDRGDLVIEVVPDEHEIGPGIVQNADFETCRLNKLLHDEQSLP